MPESQTLFPGLRPVAASRSRGVLPYQNIRALVEEGRLTAEPRIEPSQLQPASLDLRLGEFAIQLRASFLPGRRSSVLEAIGDLEIQRIDLREGAVLPRGGVFLVPLLESVRLPGNVLAKANPKSTTGRLDVFTRLIADYADHFDRVAKGYRGPLFVEIAPKTFHVRVRLGTRLNQLRLLTGVPHESDTSRKAADDSTALVYGVDGEPLKAKVARGLWFTVDLAGAVEGEPIGWRAVHDAPPIDLDLVDHYNPFDFWEPVHRRDGDQLILKPGEFYILGSKERVKVPAGYAAEMVPYDPSLGEFRVHYAGFFDPGFGLSSAGNGTRAILEVRPHEVPYALRDGQHVGRLIYERLLAPPEKLYGVDSGSSYQDQRWGLSKQFKQR